MGALEGIAEEIPSEWYGDRQDVDQLIHSLFERRAAVRQLIEDFRKSHRSPFPKWTLDEAGKHSCEHMRNSGHAPETQIV